MLFSKEVVDSWNHIIVMMMMTNQNQKRQRLPSLAVDDYDRFEILATSLLNHPSNKKKNEITTSSPSSTIGSIMTGSVVVVMMILGGYGCYVYVRQRARQRAIESVQRIRLLFQMKDEPDESVLRTTERNKEKQTANVDDVRTGSSTALVSPIIS
jgi:hypothetical protein